MRFEMNRVRMRDACMYLRREVMSIFHVQAVLKEHPELVGILGKKMISALCHAAVRRINPGVLTEKGYDSPHYIISHDGLLLAKVVTDTKREVFPWFFRKPETVLDAVRRIGAGNVAYIAQYDYGCDDVGAPCALYIFKTPADQGLAELIEAIKSKAKQEVAN